MEDALKRFCEGVWRSLETPTQGQRTDARGTGEQADLASKMISLIERFERNPSANVADRVAQGLAVPLWRLVKDAEDLRRKRSKGGS